MAFNSSVTVKSSAINGEGVFALRDFRYGEVVVRWDDTREISKDELEQLPLLERKYVEIQKDKTLLVGKPERFVNHSCEANTRPGERCDIASRDIHSGEEVTADYSQFYIPSGQFHCACGSASCRVVIRGISTEL